MNVAKNGAKSNFTVSNSNSKQDLQNVTKCKKRPLTNICLLTEDLNKRNKKNGN